MIHSDRDPSKHEEEQAVPAIPFLGTSYAKDCIPPENICNVTVVTIDRVVAGLCPAGKGPNPVTKQEEAYSYRSASAGKIRAADHDG
jgi:hypothetical protein